MISTTKNEVAVYEDSKIIATLNIPVAELPHKGDYLHMMGDTYSCGRIVSYVLRKYQDGIYFGAEIIVKNG